MPHVLFDDDGNQLGDGDKAIVYFEKEGGMFMTPAHVVWIVDETGIRQGLPRDMCVYPYLNVIRDIEEKKPGTEGIKIMRVRKVIPGRINVRL